jgi:hypothetical protein
VTFLALPRAGLLRRHGMPVLALLVAAQLLTPAVAQAQAPQPAAPARVAVPKVVAGSDWADLTPAQQAALQPLGPTWGSMSTGQRRKWLALSQNFQHLSPAERSTLHGRMTEWANLSPVQRSQARLNFAQTKQLSTDQKKAEWQAYQALPLEQKQRLAVGGQTLPSGAAPAAQPVEAHKLASVPVTRSEAPATAKAPAAKKPASKDAPGVSRPAKVASAPAQRP